MSRQLAGFAVGVHARSGEQLLVVEHDEVRAGAVREREHLAVLGVVLLHGVPTGEVVERRRVEHVAPDRRRSR